MCERWNFVYWMRGLYGGLFYRLGSSHVTLGAGKGRGREGWECVGAGHGRAIRLFELEDSDCVWTPVTVSLCLARSGGRYWGRGGAG